MLTRDLFALANLLVNMILCCAPQLRGTTQNWGHPKYPLASCRRPTLCPNFKSVSVPIWRIGPTGSLSARR